MSVHGGLDSVAPGLPELSDLGDALDELLLRALLDVLSLLDLLLIHASDLVKCELEVVEEFVLELVLNLLLDPLFPLLGCFGCILDELL